MARKPRIHYEGAFYHVIARGNNKDYIFRQDEDKVQYLERLFKYAQQYDGRLYAYVVMDNHCHMLMEVGAVGVSKIMQLVQQTYTSWYNRKYHHSGHVFEQRFKSILCDKDEYLLALVRYIHQNPVRAGTGDLNYPFSSHGLYMQYDQGVCRTPDVLGRFSNNKKKAIAHYLEFVSKTDDVIIAKTNQEMAPEQDEIEFELSRMSFDKKDKSEVMATFESRTGVQVEDLKRKYLKPNLTKLRNQLIVELVKFGAMTQVEISKTFGLSDGYVSRICHSVDKGQ